MYAKRSLNRPLVLAALCAAAGSLILLAGAGPTEPRKYALLVGINDYGAEAGLIKLDYAESDVEALAAELGRHGYEVRLLTAGEGRKDPARQPSRANIDRELKKLKFKATDLLLVGLAGHGVQLTVRRTVDGKEVVDKDSYFIPADGVPTVRNVDTLVSMNSLVQQLEESGAGTRLVLVDACRDEKNRGIRGGSETSLRLNRGTAVLFSCREGQIAHEPSEFAHGAFFYFVLKGLQGEAKNRSGAVTWSSLMDYVIPAVPNGLPQRLKDQGARQEPDDITLGAGGAVLVRLDNATPKPERIGEPFVAFAGSRAGQQRDDNGLKMKFCWCPPGTFTMGSPESELERSKDEDQVEVKLSKGFWLGKNEVTQGEWTRLMGTTLGQQQEKAKLHGNYGEGAGYPMYYVSHDEATDFCAKLTEQERRAGKLPADWAYRLPTEAHWEYACRAGTTTATAFGDRLSSRQANFNGDIPYNGADKGPDLSRTTEVGSYAANRWGLCDMHGNVWEWCRDWYQEKLPGGTDPEVVSGASRRVLRGGSWGGSGRDCRSAFRCRSTPGLRGLNFGFRVAAVQSGR